MTTDRNLSKELLYSHDIDMNGGNDMDTICYQSLFGLLTELVDRIEQLEERLNELDPPVNDIYRRTYQLDGPTGLIGDPQ